MALLLAAALLVQTDDEVAKLIEKLGSDEIAERDAAEKRLVELGDKAEPSLKKAAEGNGEPAARAKAALQKIELARIARKRFVYSAWESWDAFGDGSTVESELEVSGMKIRQIRRLERRTAEQITLKTETIMAVAGNESKTPMDEQIRREAPAVDGACPLCRKAFKSHEDRGTWGAEVLKIDGKDVACTTYESAAINCVGEAAPQGRMWYSRDVPGHLVKAVTAQMTMTVVKYEAKPRK